MTDEQTLVAQHRQISEVAQKIREIARVPDEKIGASIAPLRLKLASLLKDHFASEHELLIGRLRGPLRDKVPMLDAIVKRNRELRFEYSEHVMAWPSRAIDANPSAYARALDGMLINLQGQIELEEEHMFAPAFAAFREAGV